MKRDPSRIGWNANQNPAKVNTGENKVELVLRGRDGSAQTPPVLDAV